MGYLNGSTITVDAILTRFGRRQLAEGRGLGISQFALSDDGVDYDLWNIDHPSGSKSYGEAITNLPMIEAVPDDAVVMRNFLTTLPRTTKYLPAIRLSFSEATPLSIDGQGDEYSVTVTPKTLNFADEMYSFEVDDYSFIKMSGGTFVDISGDSSFHAPNLEIPQGGKMINAKSIEISALPIDAKREFNLTIRGQSSGARLPLRGVALANIRKLR